MGISLIIGGVSQLKGGLDSYHWETVANLAWSSAFTHMPTITVLRRDHRLTKKIKRLRVFAMGLLVMMLICVTYSVGWFTRTIQTIPYSDDPPLYSLPPSFPAWCLYHSRLPQVHLQNNDSFYPYDSMFYVSYNWVYVASASAILIFTYLTRILLLFSWSVPEMIHAMACLLRLNKLPSILIRLGFPTLKGIEPTLEIMNKKSVMYRLLRSLYTLMLSAKHMYTSTLWEVCKVTLLNQLGSL